MVFVVPFAVSNQGTGIFWYLGLFILNTNTDDIRQIDTLFIGDRITVNSLKTIEKFDVTPSLELSYLTHHSHQNQQQSMSKIPRKEVALRINISLAGFST